MNINRFRKEKNIYPSKKQKSKKEVKIGIVTSRINSSIGFITDDSELNLTLTGNVSEELINKFDAGLKQKQLELSNISEIYFDIGPGSYTGIRIGMAFVKMLEYLLKIKITCVSGADIMKEIFFSFLNKKENLKNIPLFIIEKTYNDKYSVIYKRKRMTENFLLTENEVRNMINKISKNNIHGFCGNFDFKIDNKNIITKKHILTGIDLISHSTRDLTCKMEPIYLFSKKYKCLKKN